LSYGPQTGDRWRDYKGSLTSPARAHFQEKFSDSPSLARFFLGHCLALKQCAIELRRFQPRQRLRGPFEFVARMVV